MAQVVAHLIGSEEVTGSTPVASFEKPLIFKGLFLIVRGKIRGAGMPVFHFMTSETARRFILYDAVRKFEKLAERVSHHSKI